MTKEEALSNYLNINIEDVYINLDNTFTYDGISYLILTEEEAFNKFKDYIKENINLLRVDILATFLGHKIDFNSHSGMILQQTIKNMSSEDLRNEIDIHELSLYIYKESIDPVNDLGGYGAVFNSIENKEYTYDEYLIYPINT